MNATAIPHAPGDTDSPRRLPVDVRPRSTDTIDSYIRRLAAANHLKPDDLHGYLRHPSAHRSRPRLERLAAISGRTLSTLQRVLTDLRCAGCGQPQPLPADIGRPGRWCSTACRKAAHRQRHPSTPKAPVESACRHCGTVVTKRRAVPWCSRRCKDAARRAALRAPVESTCEHCGRHVIDTRTIRWCSPSCRQAAWNRPGECGICARPLVSAPVGRPPKWCSPRCRQAADRECRRALAQL
jgi:hypothetical protein